MNFTNDFFYAIVVSDKNETKNKGGNFNEQRKAHPSRLHSSGRHK